LDRGQQCHQLADRHCWRKRQRQWQRQLQRQRQHWHDLAQLDDDDRGADLYRHASWLIVHVHHRANGIEPRHVAPTLAGTTEPRREVDPLLSFEALQARVPDYTAGRDAALGLISPVFADLSGLPPLIIQAGTHEVLLDDALRLAERAATADVQVTLDITPGVPHVFQAYHSILDEAAAALDRAGRFLSAHLAESPTLETRIA